MIILLYVVAAYYILVRFVPQILLLLVGIYYHCTDCTFNNIKSSMAIVAVHSVRWKELVTVRQTNLNAYRRIEPCPFGESLKQCVDSIPRRSNVP